MLDDLVVELDPPTNRRGKCQGKERHLTEAAVMLAYGMHLLRTVPSLESVELHPDGEHAKRFEIVQWLSARGFELKESHGTTAYCGTYSNGRQTIVIASTPGKGDVVARTNDEIIVAECKGGIINTSHAGQKSRLRNIAGCAGKSEAYVYGRIKLADLIPPVAEAFLKDQITIGHALLIAKLPAAQQQEAFAAAFRGMWTSEGNSQVLIPVRELAVWIESNILLQLASAPFDKQDEKLVPDAGSCANCPKRTGFNKLLFADVRKDSCTDPQCFRSKIDAHVAKTLESKPSLVQISSAWNSREGAPLGRNQYVELEIKKAKANGSAAKLPAAQKPCDKMAEAIVMDGGKRGQTVKVCADR